MLSVTVQSSRVVPGRFAIRPWMQGALTYSTISLAMLDSAGEKSSSQIESVVPLAPNWRTNSLMRTAGSAKLPSVAVQVCWITGQGQDAAPQDVSVLGAFQPTT